MRYAIVVAIEDYHNSDRISKVDFAQNDADAIKCALMNLGYIEENIIYIPSNKATKTAIENALIKISRITDTNDEIFIYYAGHGFNDGGTNLLSCVDTDLSSLKRSCLSTQKVLEILNKSKSKRITLFIDCCHSGLEFTESSRSSFSQFSTEDLKYQFSDVEYLTCFASCKGDEKSWPDRTEKHGVWTSFLLRALNGDATEIYESGLIFSDKLQSYLLNETRIRARTITTKKEIQTPIKFGKETDRFIVADVSALLATKMKPPVSIELDNVKIVGSESGNVRSLPGFIKGKHKEPDQISDYHSSWIKQISKDLLQDEINEVGDKLKSALKFKRKDVFNASVEDGIGEITTKYFDYIVKVKQSRSEKHKYVITRSLENFSDDFTFIDDDAFNACFNNGFNALLLPLNGKISVENIIDKIEEIDDEGIISAKYDVGDISKCNIRIPGFDGEIIVNSSSLKIRSRRDLTPQELIESLTSCNQKIIESTNLKLIG